MISLLMPPGEYTVYGRVFDEQGQSVEGAHVMLADQSRGPYLYLANFDVTDAAGRFIVQAAPSSQTIYVRVADTFFSLQTGLDHLLQRAKGLVGSQGHDRVQVFTARDPAPEIKLDVQFMGQVRRLLGWNFDQPLLIGTRQARARPFSGRVGKPVFVFQPLGHGVGAFAVTKQTQTDLIEQVSWQCCHPSWYT